MTPKVPAAIIDGHDGEAVETVGEIDGVAGAHDHDDAEQEEEISHVEDEAVDQRNGEACDVGRSEHHHRVAGDAAR